MLKENTKAYDKFRAWYGFGGMERAEILHEWQDGGTYYLVVFFHGWLDFLRIFPLAAGWELSKDKTLCVYREMDAVLINNVKHFPMQDVKDIIDKLPHRLRR